MLRMSFSLKVKRYVNGALIQVAGDIDTLTAPQLQDCLTGELSDQSQLFVLDMGEVRYISSMGLRVFLSHLKRLKPKNGSISIAKACKLVCDVFQMSGFSAYFEITDNLESCVAKLGAPSTD